MTLTETPFRIGNQTQKLGDGSATPRPVIFDYLNYREFLRDFYKFKKSENRGYSYAVFSQRAGIKSPNYLKLVMEGARNVTSDSILAFAKALGLQGIETIYWENLVAYNQAKTEEQRRHYFVKLIQSPLPARPGEGGDRIREIKDEWDYYASWHAAAIRELVHRDDFSEDPAVIARLLRNRLTPEQAREALALLIRLKFLVRGEDGMLRQAHRIVSYFSEQDVRNFAIRQFHRSTGELALTSLEEDAPSERDFSGLTMSIDESALPALKKKITEFRDAVIEEFTRCETARQVVHVNFQVIPITEVRKPPS